MDSYLVLAQKVLERARRPLTPRELLREAYRLDLVPYHLHGATQHKTLQARLSEHILSFRENGIFFRTAPGRFFLRTFLDDQSIPEEFRKPIIARRRVRELRRKNVLTVAKQSLPHSTYSGQSLPAETLHRPIAEHRFQYSMDVTCRSSEEVAVWSFVVVTRDNEVLTYRQGRYREDRDAFHQKRCIGFYAPVVRDDRNLFDGDGHGVVSSGLETLALDLDLAADSTWQKLASKARLHAFLYIDTKVKTDLLGIVRINCPAWFEPLTTRLAINELSWHDLSSPVNHVEDFDPWSQLVLVEAQTWMRGGLEKHGSKRAWSD